MNEDSTWIPCATLCNSGRYSSPFWRRCVMHLNCCPSGVGFRSPSMLYSVHSSTRESARGRLLISLIYFALSVAVGMPAARHPPHRSLRAAFPHRAPASGSDAQAIFRIRGGRHQRDREKDDRRGAATGRRREGAGRGHAKHQQDHPGREDAQARHAALTAKKKAVQGQSPLQRIPQRRDCLPHLSFLRDVEQHPLGKGWFMRRGGSAPFGRSTTYKRNPAPLSSRSKASFLSSPPA